MEKQLGTCAGRVSGAQAPLPGSGSGTRGSTRPPEGCFYPFIKPVIPRGRSEAGGSGDCLGWGHELASWAQGSRSWKVGKSIYP